MRVGIQADDLTGACDTGCVFAARGLETLVLLPEAPFPALPPTVLVLDTESRHGDRLEARERARAAVTRLAACNPGLVYKKLDSTLRGSIAAELGGVLEGAGAVRAVVAPAFPGQRRTVVDGRLRIGQRPAGETPVARDPAFPPTGDSVLALLGVAGPHPTALLPLATVRRGASAVAARIARHAGSLVCDAETEADLAVLAAAAGDLPVVLAGSAGLAAAVAARLSRAAPRSAPAPRSPLLVVAGSAHPVTRAQLARLEARGVSGVWPPDPGGARDGDREAMVRALAEAARARLARGAPGTLLLTGGETAYSVCRAIEATGIALDGEVEPGLAVGRLLGGPFAGLAVVTKAGGFGDPETLARLHEACT
jgi:D-threonate/D-erythronate kinase